VQRIFTQTHKPIQFSFKQSIEDFKVEEIPQNQFSGRGNFLILHIEKKNLSTWDLLNSLSQMSGINNSEFGYAGLKDKHATSQQYISIHKKYERSLKNIRHKNIKILKTHLNQKPLSIGDLQGNRFTLKIKNLQLEQKENFETIFNSIKDYGMPNYFGYQRFGRDGSSFEEAKSVVYGDKFIKDSKLRKFLASAYQSHFFNNWLHERIKISQKNNELFTILSGDVMLNLKENKLFTPKELEKTVENFKNRTIVPTGLLPGRKVWRSMDKAYEIEKKFDDSHIHEKGSRRAAWIYPSEMKFTYNEKTKSAQLKFSLPKSSYATVLLENIANKNFTSSKNGFIFKYI